MMKRQEGIVLTACARCRSRAKQSIIIGTWIIAGSMKPCFLNWLKRSWT